MTSTGAHILVADDDATSRELLRNALEQHHHEVSEAADGEEALAVMRSRDLDLIIADVRMPRKSGLDVLRTAKELALEAEVIVTTGYAELGVAVECLRGGAFDFLQKPFDLQTLLTTVDNALERRFLVAQTALYQASQAIFSTRELHRLPATIVEVGMKVMGADDVSLMLPDENGNLYVAHAHGLTAEVMATVRVALGERISGRVALSREPLLLSEASLPTEQFSHVRSYNRVRSSIIYPLSSDNRLVGVLNISRVVNTRPFRKQDLERASVLASQVLLALENSRLVRHMVSRERLATVGSLAASIGHEINNPVTYMVANQMYIRKQLLPLLGMLNNISGTADADTLLQTWQNLGGKDFGNELLQALNDAEEGAKHVRAIAYDLHSMVRLDDEQRSCIDINESVRAALRLGSSRLRGQVDVHTVYGDNLRVNGHMGRLTQVIVNLVSNAVQAMNVDATPPDNRKLLINTRRIEGRVQVQVSDSGPGIAPVHLARLFEPFFTTKAAGEGTGLGLPISRDIVRSHGGDILVQSTLGQGATFTVDLPAA